jgi:peptide/nickel transport system ATP-binding protein
MNKGAIVEFGEAKQVLSSPQHAYTQLLLDSIPRLDRRWAE